MKAIAKTGPQLGVELVDVDDPRPGPGEVLVEVKACGICGTDLHVYLSELGFERRLTYPRVLGHEPSGIVREVGQDVDGFRPGDHVVGEPHGACGRCAECREGRSEFCDRIPIMGGQRDGALAAFVAAPAECLRRVPNDLDFISASLLEPLSAGVHAVDISRLKPRDAAVVLGPGPIGLMTALAARAAGAATVVVTGLAVDHGRLDMAERLGFRTVNVESEEPVERIQELVGARGAEVVFDATGALPDVHLIVRKGGRVVQMGWPSRAPSLEEVTQLFLRSVTLVPLRWRPEAIWPRVIDLVTSGRIDPRPLVTHEVPLADGIHGFELLVNRAAMKVMIRPG